MEETYDAKYSMMLSPAASNVYPYETAPPVAVELSWLELLLVLSFSSFVEDDKDAKRVL